MKYFLLILLPWCCLSYGFLHSYEDDHPLEVVFRSLIAKTNASQKKPPKKRVLLITGCARSGTHFIATFFKFNGIDLKHEHIGAYGIVAWTMAADADITPWSPGANLYAFQHIFQQVRHPLKTIASASNEPTVSWKYIQQFVPEIQWEDPKIVKGAKYWYYWNLLAEKKAEWTYRIEDIENQIGEMEARLGIRLNPAALEIIPKDRNTRSYKDVYTWDDLKQALDPDLFYNIVAMAIRYGYEVDDLL